MSDEPWLVVGLGNPGPKYAANRHNIGFVVIDQLAQDSEAPAFRDKFRGEFVRTPFRKHELVLLKPQTYMNLSGESVQPAAAFFKIPVERIVVVHDELDLPFGTVRLKVGGGLAGHNGLRSMAEQLGTQDFLRLRMGIGRPRSGSVSNYVLSDFSSLESAELVDVIDRAIRALGLLFSLGPQKAMGRVNAAPKVKKEKPNENSVKPGREQSDAGSNGSQASE